MRFVPQMGLPLLAKELAEQSARRRTYIVRTGYACLLFTACSLYYFEILSRQYRGPLSVLGHGRQIFQSLIYLQFTGVYFFMPAITCGVLTMEKERNSLGLLLLTRLGPWTILLEKYVGRLIPMFTFLLLSLPLLVVAYSMGGVTPSYLLCGIWMLIVTTLQAGALALMCSAVFRTTVASFIGTYVIGFLFLFMLPLLDGMRILPIEDVLNTFVMTYLGYDLWGGHRGLAQCIFFLPPVFTQAERIGVFNAFLTSIPALVSVFAFLGLSRVFVVRRAFAQPRNALLRVFRGMDRFYQKINHNRLTRGIVLIRASSTLPRDKPISWRETTKRSLGTLSYLIRLFVVLEFTVVMGCVLVGATGMQPHEPLGVFAMVLWVFAALILTVKGTSLIAGERAHETLDVLLTTPLACDEIISQKYAAMRRLILVLSVPLLTIAVFKTWWMATVMGGDIEVAERLLYVTCSILTVAIYLPLVAWVSLLIGIVIRSHARAIFTGVAVWGAWCAVPVFLVVMLIEILDLHRNSPVIFVALASPAMIIPFNEFVDLDEFCDAPWLAVIANTMIHGSLMFVFRYLCRNNAKDYLGRCEVDQEIGTSSELTTGEAPVGEQLAPDGSS